MEEGFELLGTELLGLLDDGTDVGVELLGTELLGALDDGLELGKLEDGTLNGMELVGMFDVGIELVGTLDDGPEVEFEFSAAIIKLYLDVWAVTDITFMFNRRLTNSNKLKIFIHNTSYQFNFLSRAVINIFFFLNLL